MKNKINKLSLPISRELVEAIDKWRGLRPGVPSRSEAIRSILIDRLKADGAEVPENVKG